MLRIEYDREVSNYFLDNGKLTRDLHIAIESLFFTDGIPTTGEYNNLGKIRVWKVLQHVVVYTIVENTLTVQTVKPL